MTARPPARPRPQPRARARIDASVPACARTGPRIRARGRTGPRARARSRVRADDPRRRDLTGARDVALDVALDPTRADRSATPRAMSLRTCP